MQSYGAGSIGSAMAGEAKGFIENYAVLFNENSSLDEQLNAAAAMGAILTSYDSSADYWRRRFDGTLVYDGSGWLRDESGNYINRYGHRTDSITEDTIGAENIKQGLLNILYGGTSNEPLNSYSSNRQNLAKNLINTTKSIKGAKLDMNSLMSLAGATVAETVFQTYYNNTMDYRLASDYNVDLIFNTRGNWNPNQVPYAATQRYITTIADRQNNYQRESGSVERALLNKYITTVDFSDKTSENLLKITQNNPYVSMLLNQNDPIFKIENTPLYNKDLYWSGCNFMATIAIPQLLTGNIFDAQTATNIWNWAVSNKVIESSASVNDPASLATYALQSVIGEKNMRLEFSRDSISSPSANSMFIAIREQYDPSHFVLGGINQSMVYNPWPGLIRPHNRYDGVFLQTSYKGR
jgi:hypothetical protein